MRRDGAILVLGGGLIGSGWAAAFAGAGLSAIVIDPSPEARARIAEVWRKAAAALQALGQLSPHASPPRWIPCINAMTEPTNFVQEALPEKLSLKRDVLRAIEPALAPETPIASSSSGLTPSALQEGLRHPQRLLIGHPCNPPYLMPTVEIVGGRLTAPAALDVAEQLYRSMGKTVLRLQKEYPGHLVNRLQFALWREAVHLVASGAASVAAVEQAVSVGLAPRWTVIGPTTVFHLAGGDGGLAKFLDDLGGEVEAWWSDLGAPRLDATTRAALTDGIRVALAGASCAETVARRDRGMIALARTLRDNVQSGDRPQPGG